MCVHAPDIVLLSSAMVPTYQVLTVFAIPYIATVSSRFFTLHLPSRLCSAPWGVVNIPLGPRVTMVSGAQLPSTQVLKDQAPLKGGIPLPL